MTYGRTERPAMRTSRRIHKIKKYTEEEILQVVDFSLLTQDDLTGVEIRVINLETKKDVSADAIEDDSETTEGTTASFFLTSSIPQGVYSVLIIGTTETEKHIIEIRLLVNDSFLG
jgi:hypothetical protein